jgi:hypothetical protein
MPALASSAKVAVAVDIIPARAGRAVAGLRKDPPAILENGRKKKLKNVLHVLGRLLQLAGLILLPVAMAGNLADKQDLRSMLALTGVGVVIFLIGWQLQQACRPR